MLQYEFSEKYRGFGFSHGLQRGLLVYHDGALLVEEGMGLGICAYQTGGFTFFSSLLAVKSENGSTKAVFNLDTKLVWRVFGIKSIFLTRILEAIATNHYMKQEQSQRKILRLGAWLSKLFQIDASFLDVEPQGQVDIIWQSNGYDVDITVGCNNRRPGGKLFVMNELGGIFFHEAQTGGRRTAAPTGWQRLTDPCELICPAHSLAFGLAERQVPSNVQSKLYWGREVTGKINWSGFECELMWETEQFSDYKYTVKFREVTP